MNATLNPINTDSVNVRDVVSGETSLKVIRNDFLEQCPFCGSGTGPKGTSAFSFHANGYKCFSCEQTGDAVRFIERYHRISTGEAIRYFKSKYLNQDEGFGNMQQAKNHIKKMKLKDNKFDVMSPWTLDMFHENFTEDNLTQYLLSKFDEKTVLKVLNAYQVKTSSGGTNFPYIDDQGDIRTVKLMKYVEDTGKRDRSVFPFYLHKQMEGDQFNFKRCLFGQHLISKSDRIGIVESEKTAIVCSIAFPEMVFLATGGKNVLNVNDLQSIKSLYEKEITLFPDHDSPDKTGMTTYEQWSYIATELKNKGFQVTVDDTLEGDRCPYGYDLADVILEDNPDTKVDPEPSVTVVEEIKTPQPDKPERPKQSEPSTAESDPELEEVNLKTASIDRQRAETEQRQKRLDSVKEELSVLNIPDYPVVMDPSVILDAAKFISSHLKVVEIKINKDISEPYLLNLERFIEVLKEEE